MENSLTKSQVKAIEMLGRQAPNGSIIFFTGTTIITNGYTIIKLNKELPDIDHDELEAEQVAKIVSEIEQTADTGHEILVPAETMTHPNGRMMIERYGKSWYDPDIIKRVKRVLGGKNLAYREYNVNENVTAIVIVGRDGWAAVMPIRIEEI